MGSRMTMTLGVEDKLSKGREPNVANSGRGSAVAMGAAPGEKL